MNEVKYFDSFAFIGKRPLEDPVELWSAAHVKELMERCSIHAALVYHTLAREYNPNIGNQLMLGEMKKNPRFYGCYVAMPHHTGEMAHPDEWVNQLRGRNFYAVKIFPSTHQYNLDERTVGGLCSALEKAGIPLLIDINETDFEKLEFLLKSFPNLPILAQQLYWSQSRKVIPSFREYRNLYIEFSSYQGHWMLEWYCENFGCDRLLFGSEMPLKLPGAARSYIDYADLTLTQKQMIASGNLMRLLRIDRIPDLPEQRCDSILSRVKRGEPLSHLTVIDAHAHVSHDNATGASPVFMPYSDPGIMLKKFDRMGVQQILVSSWLGIWQDSVLGGELMLKLMQKYPDRYVPYATIDPNFRSDEEIAADIQLYHHKHRFPGIKPYYPRWQYRLTGEKLAPWFQYGNDHSLFALIHYDKETTIEDLKTLAPKYPNLMFIVAHSGSSYKEARKLIELAGKYSNIFLELTFTTVFCNVIELLCQEVGAERVLFGTDAPMRDPAPQLGWVAYAQISEEAKRMILGENIQIILKRTFSK